MILEKWTESVVLVAIYYYFNKTQLGSLVFING